MLNASPNDMMEYLAVNPEEVTESEKMSYFEAAYRATDSISFLECMLTKNLWFDHDFVKKAFLKGTWIDEPTKRLAAYVNVLYDSMEKEETNLILYRNCCNGHCASEFLTKVQDRDTIVLDDGIPIIGGDYKVNKTIHDVFQRFCIIGYACGSVALYLTLGYLIWDIKMLMENGFIVHTDLLGRDSNINLLLVYFKLLQEKGTGKFAIAEVDSHVSTRKIIVLTFQLIRKEDALLVLYSLSSDQYLHKAEINLTTTFPLLCCNNSQPEKVEGIDD